MTPKQEALRERSISLLVGSKIFSPGRKGTLSFTPFFAEAILKKGNSIDEILELTGLHLTNIYPEGIDETEFFACLECTQSLLDFYGIKGNEIEHLFV